MTVVKQFNPGTLAWEAILVGAPGPTGPTGPPGPGGEQGPAGIGTGGVGVPTGGALGAQLTKASATDYHMVWQTSTAGITTEDAVDAVAAALVAGANVTITYDDAANTITIASTGGGGGGITTEDAVDAVATALVAGTNVTITYNDAANTITIASTGGVGTGVTDGDKGDIVVSASGATWLFDSSVVTAAAKTVLDDTTTTAMRGTLGLSNVDNTSDVNKPVSTAQAAADALKVTNVAGVSGIWTGNQAAYDAIGIKNATVLYVIT